MRRVTSLIQSAAAGGKPAPWVRCPYLTVTRAQSQPSSPRALTAFTDTTMPGVAAGTAAGGFETRVVPLSGPSGVPHATI